MHRFFFTCLLMFSAHVLAVDRLDIKAYRLPNGLQLLLKPGTERDHVAIRLVVGVGMDDFKCADKELPHLLEHLFFSGIGSGGAAGLNEQMHALGIEWNAYTRNADTTFVIESPAHNQQKVLELLLAILTHTELTDAAITAAKRAVVLESGGHYSRLQRLLDRQNLGQTASNQLAVELGLECAERAEVDHLTHDQLQAVRKELYAPNNMKLIIVGDLDEHLPAYLERAYGQLKPVELSNSRPLPETQYAAAARRELVHGWVGNGVELHWLFPEAVLEDQHDEVYDLLKDYMGWLLYRQLRLERGLSYAPWSEREVLGGVVFFSLNTDLERDNLAEAEQLLEAIRAQLLKDGLDPVIFTRIQQAAIARQSWAVQGNSALADYYWSTPIDRTEGRFSDPVTRIKAVTLAQANFVMRQALNQPGYWRIEQPLFSYNTLSWMGACLLALIMATVFAGRRYRIRITKSRRSR